jgi:hypothetical protein
MPAAGSIFIPERDKSMKTTNEQIKLNILMIENEEIPEWVKTQTVWVETSVNTQTTSSQEVKA